MRVIHQGNNDLLAQALERAFALSGSPPAGRAAASAPAGVLNALAGTRPAPRPPTIGETGSILGDLFVSRLSAAPGPQNALAGIPQSQAMPADGRQALGYPQAAQGPAEQFTDAREGQFYGNMPQDQLSARTELDVQPPQSDGPWSKYQSEQTGPAFEMEAPDGMETFEIQGPDGKLYEVQAPNQQAALEGFKQFAASPAQTSGPWEKYQASEQQVGQPNPSQPEPASFEVIMKALRHAVQIGDTAAATRLAQMAQEEREHEQQQAPANARDRRAAATEGNGSAAARDGEPQAAQTGSSGASTFEEIIAKSRELHAQGDIEGAKRLGRIALQRREQQSAASGVPEDVKARWAAAKAGTLEASPDSLARHAASNAIGEVQNEPQPGYLKQGLLDFAAMGKPIHDMDAARAAAAGASRGLTGILDMPGAAFGAGARLGAWTAEKTGLATPEDAAAASGMVNQLGEDSRFGGGSTHRASMAEATGRASEYQGTSRLAKYAGTVGEFLPSAMLSPGNVVRNALTYGALPGAASEAAGQATEGTKYEPWARLAAAMAAPAVAGLGEKGLRSILSPHGGADPERLALAQVLDDAGIPISAGQRVGNEGLLRKEGMTRVGEALNEAQREALTKAALRTAGADARRATPEVLEETARRIGSVFDEVARGVDVTPDPKTITALSTANETYKQLAPKSAQAPIVGEIVKRMTGAFRTGESIPASTVNSWRSSLSRLTASNDGATRSAAIEALTALDDAMSSTLTSLGRADDVARLATARDQWRNFLAIQKAATSAGEAAAVGILSPSALRNAVVQQGRASYAQGSRGELGELARAAEGVIKPLGTSGTAENLRAMGLPTVGWTGLGAGAGAIIGGGPAGAIAGSIVGSAAPAALGAARMSGPGQAWLANQLVGRGRPAFTTKLLAPLSPAAIDMPGRGADKASPQGRGVLAEQFAKRLLRGATGKSSGR